MAFIEGCPNIGGGGRGGLTPMCTKQHNYRWTNFMPIVEVWGKGAQ